MPVPRRCGTIGRGSPYRVLRRSGRTSVGPHPCIPAQAEAASLLLLPPQPQCPHQPYLSQSQFVIMGSLALWRQ